MGDHQTADSSAATPGRWARPPLAGCARGPQRHPLDSAQWRALARLARALPTRPDLPPSLPTVGARRHAAPGAGGAGGRPAGARGTRPQCIRHRWHLCRRKTRGLGVGTTKRGKGTKLLAVADRAGLPLAVHTASAPPHEVTLVPATLAAPFTTTLPERLVGDKADDSDPRDGELATVGIELLAPIRIKLRLLACSCHRAGVDTYSAAYAADSFDIRWPRSIVRL
jgi:hypothetical protein